MQKTVCELFAGIGGFRLGLEGEGWKTVWFSQWEPGATRQHAHECYVRHFGDTDVGPDTCSDIAIVDKELIPDHTLLVGGFPCQDYSVAKPLTESKGIEGKKGVLWWSIRDVIKAKHPAYCLFENVDRLLRSPAKKRGRDFGVILRCLHDLGYNCEWRAVNAADYGCPQRRRRVFIFAFRKGQGGVLQEAFPAKEGVRSLPMPLDISSPLHKFSESFAFDFRHAGRMLGSTVETWDAIPIADPIVPLASILEADVADSLYVPDKDLPKWTHQKGAKRESRTTKTGFSYIYTEGGMAFPDDISLPSRTILTSEGSLNRSTHVVPGKDGRLRKLSATECERLQGFPDGWTEGMTERMRRFCCGNALPVPLVKRIAVALNQLIKLS